MNERVEDRERRKIELARDFTQFFPIPLTPRTETETLAGTEQLHPPCAGGAATVAGGTTTVVCIWRENEKGGRSLRGLLRGAAEE